MGKESSKSYAMTAFAAVCVMNIVFVGIGWNSLSLFATPVTEEWGITRTAFMLTVTLVAACNTVVSMFFYGLIIQKLGMRKAILLGGALTTAGIALFAFAQNVAMLYATGVLFGTGCALMNNNAVNAVVTTWFRKNEGKYMSIASTCGSVMGIIAATGVAALILAASWRMTLAIIAVLFVVATALCFVLYKGDPSDLGVSPLYADEVPSQSGEEPGEQPQDGPSYSEMLKSPRFWGMVPIMLVCGVVGYAIMANLPLIAADYGFADLSGTVLSAALLASAVFLIIGGAILDKLGSAWLYAICFGFLVIAMGLLLSGASSVIVVFAVALLVGAAYDMCMIAPGITTMEAFGRKDYARKMGTLCGFVYAGIALAPTVLNLFYDLGGGYGTAYIVFIVLAIVAAIAVFPLVRHADKGVKES